MEKKTTEGKNAAKIEAYLQGPRKKRKNYVIFAMGESGDRELGMALEGFVRKAYPALAVTQARTPEELTRQFGRNISLLVVNDLFIDRAETMKLLRSLKDKRRDEAIPVLFLTRDRESLIRTYHEQLLVYNESDDYIVLPDATMPEIQSAIRKGVDAKNRRKSRRYPVDLPVSYYHLNENTVSEARLIDISMHGALLSADPDTILRLGDQIKISIPVSDYLRLDTGDLIRISGRVRRVFISGHQVAFSFEHVTEQQSQQIGQLILAVAGRYFSTQTNRLKAQAGAQTNAQNRR